MKERNADVTRTKKQNEGVIDKHFFGEYGIQKSLESISRINMSTKMITHMKMNHQNGRIELETEKHLLNKSILIPEERRATTF